LLTTSTRYYNTFYALASPIMAIVLAFMTTGKLLIAYIIALSYKSTTDYRRLQERSSTRARLRLTVYDWTFFAKPHMAGFSTFMFTAIQLFIAC
jgi:hypothetical protein